MAARKKVNRNPFNEKLIHRYLLEVFYGIHGSDRASINKLLPSRLHHSRINLVVPEEHLPKRGYRPDLTLFFQGQKQGVPVEIKRVANKVPDNQLRYLASKKGILLSLDSPISSYPGVCCSQIEWERLCDWFSRSSLRLLRDAFNPDKAKGGTGWVVVLRGHSGKRNFERMLKASGRRECFWAFKNNPTSIKSVLELSKGDQLLFLFASTKGAGQGEKYEGNKMMLNAGNMNIEILDWYIGEVKDPYYMVPSGPRSTFFEAGKPPINDRRWPHFVGFSIVSKMRAKIPEKFRRRELARSFAISANHGGIPVRLPPNYWEELISRLKAADETSALALPG